LRVWGLTLKIGEGLPKALTPGLYTDEKEEESNKGGKWANCIV